MARPVNADAGATRLAVLDAATRLFAEQGPGRTSIRAVAREAGVTLATVHHYYGSKNGLHGACIDAMYEQLAGLREQLVPTLLSGRPVDEVLTEAVRVAFRFARAHKVALRLLMREVLDIGHLREDRRDTHLLPFLEQGAPVLARLVGADVLTMRLMLQSANHLVVRYALTSDEELRLITGKDDLAEAVDAVQDHVASMLCGLMNTGLMNTEQPGSGS